MHFLEHFFSRSTFLRRHVKRFKNNFPVDSAIFAGRRFQAAHELESTRSILPRESDIWLRHFPTRSRSASTARKLVLSAHNHVGQVREEQMTRTRFRHVSGKFGSKYVEIVMPTCSYRMGVYQMAYGYVVCGTLSRDCFSGLLFLETTTTFTLSLCTFQAAFSSLFCT